MQVENLREAGPFEIETICELSQDWQSGRFETASFAVVYGDTDQPSHSIRVFTMTDL